jgi:hypothetical protein
VSRGEGELLTVPKPRAVGLLSVCLTVKPVGEPDALIGHVRFDERGWETERCRMAQATAPILDSTKADNPVALAFVRFWRWSQRIDATLYLIGKRWSVTMDQRFRRGFTAAEKTELWDCWQGVNRSKRLDERLVSRHHLFITRWPRTAGFGLRHGVARGWH